MKTAKTCLLHVQQISLVQYSQDKTFWTYSRYGFYAFSSTNYGRSKGSRKTGLFLVATKRGRGGVSAWLLRKNTVFLKL